MAESDVFLDYFSAMEQERRDAVHRAFASMTNRERNLFREAAVMGYALGAMAEAGVRKATIPGDRQVVTEVVLGCRAHEDLYPVVAAATEGVRRRKGRWNA